VLWKTLGYRLLHRKKFFPPSKKKRKGGMVEKGCIRGKRRAKGDVPVERRGFLSLREGLKGGQGGSTKKETKKEEVGHLETE